jgi:hypothetical protein
MVPAVTDPWYSHFAHTSRFRFVVQDEWVPHRGQTNSSGQRSFIKYSRHACSLANLVSNFRQGSGVIFLLHTGYHNTLGLLESTKYPSNTIFVHRWYTHGEPYGVGLCVLSFFVFHSYRTRKQETHNTSEVIGTQTLTPLVFLFEKTRHANK